MGPLYHYFFNNKASWSFYSDNNAITVQDFYSIDNLGGMSVTITSNYDPDTFHYDLTYDDGYNESFVINNSVYWAPTCFIAGTLVKLKSGIYKAIEKVSPSEQVSSYDFTNDTWESGNVHMNICHTYNGMIYIINEKIHITPDHKVWINDELSTIKDLKLGDYLRNDKYEKIYIYSITQYKYEGLVYNLKIDKYENYIANDLLVHNKCPFLYSFYNGDICFEQILLKDKGSKDKRAMLEYTIKYPTNRFCIKELEPETTHIFNIKLKVIKSNGEEVLYDAENLDFSEPYILKQGMTLYTNFPEKALEDLKSISYIIDGYYIYDEN